MGAVQQHNTEGILFAGNQHQWLLHQRRKNRCCKHVVSVMMTTERFTVWWPRVAGRGSSSSTAPCWSGVCVSMLASGKPRHRPPPPASGSGTWRPRWQSSYGEIKVKKKMRDLKRRKQEQCDKTCPTWYFTLNPLLLCNPCDSMSGGATDANELQLYAGTVHQMHGM